MVGQPVDDWCAAMEAEKMRRVLPAVQTLRVPRWCVQGLREETLNSIQQKPPAESACRVYVYIGLQRGLVSIVADVIRQEPQTLTEGSRNFLRGFISRSVCGMESLERLSSWPLAQIYIEALRNIYERMPTGIHIYRASFYPLILLGSGETPPWEHEAISQQTAASRVTRYHSPNTRLTHLSVELVTSPRP